MASSFYFHLEPQRLGTFEVESLGSYLRRLAAHHGATLFQLLTHLDAWSRLQGGRPTMHLSKRCQDGQYGGYATDVSHIVRVTEAATGARSLRGTTLLALNQVCARNGIGVRRCRAWCPACYREAEATGLPPYDRLLWQIQGIHRCPIHNVRLAQRCWQCGGIQKGNASTTTLDRCALCDASLANQSTERCTPRDDIFSMDHVESLLEFTSSVPDVEFKRRHLTTFCRLMMKCHDRRTVDSHLGGTFHTGWQCGAPTLATLLSISSYFDAPVHWILTDPVRTAAQPGLGFDPIVRSRPTRRYGDPVKAANVLRVLGEVINGKPPFPSIPAVASLAGTSSGYLRAKYGDKVAELVALRRRTNSASKHIKTRRAAKMLTSFKWPADVTTEKERIRCVAQEVSTSISHVRQIRKAMMDSHGAPTLFST